MKQGSATHSGSGATKPGIVAHTSSPAYAAGLGVMKGNHSEHGTVRVSKIPMYEGRGLEAPAMKTTVHRKGSQS